MQINNNIFIKQINVLFFDRLENNLILLVFERFGVVVITKHYFIWYSIRKRLTFKVTPIINTIKTPFS